MFDRLLSFVLTISTFGLLIWLANRKSRRTHGGQIVSAPLVTRVFGVLLAGASLFIVSQIAENVWQACIGYTLVGFLLLECLRVLSTKIVVSDQAIIETSIFSRCEILWCDVEAVRSSRIDAAFVISSRYGSKIKVHYLFAGSIRLEEEVMHRINSRERGFGP